MKIDKAVELLQALEKLEPKAEVVFDNYRNYEEFIPDLIYDLNSINLNYKGGQLVIGLAFEKRIENDTKSTCRMKNMGSQFNIKSEVV